MRKSTPNLIKIYNTLNGSSQYRLALEIGRRQPRLSQAAPSKRVPSRKDIITANLCVEPRSLGVTGRGRR